MNKAYWGKQPQASAKAQKGGGMEKTHIGIAVVLNLAALGAFIWGARWWDDYKMRKQLRRPKLYDRDLY